MRPQTDRFEELARENLAIEKQRNILNLFPAILKQLRDSSFQSLDETTAMEKGRRIREDAIKNLPSLLEIFEENATRAGATVVWARDAEEATDYVVSLAREKGVNLCVKGKSMVSEEIGLTGRLIENGVDSYETDLGEFIIQLAGRPPFHIVGPAINMTTDEISELFHEKIGSPKTDDPNELGMRARIYLRDKFKDAQLGITGANAAVAETGSIILVENEGNIRYATSAPRIHIAIMGIEKVVATLSDATHMLKLLTRSCTGQVISKYVSVITGPRREGEIDGPEELYIVILDNGRSKIYADEMLRGSLRCIKCGLCSGVCPIYTRVGGYTYGWVYSGPIGAVLNPLLLGLGKARDLYHATTLCGACNNYCPAGVDLRNILLDMRKKEMEGNRSFGAKKPSFLTRAIFRFWTWGLLNSSLYRLGSSFLRILTAPFVRKEKIAWLPGRLSGWTKFRDMPRLAPKTFHREYQDLNQ
jgi:L-lactate dehydrogenase complex protein LldF